MKLRDYQVSAIEQIDEHIRNGKKRILLCASPGAGKTNLSASFIRRCLDYDYPCVFIVRGRDLVNNAADRFKSLGLDFSVAMAGDWRFDLKKLLQICSVDTLKSRSIFPHSDKPCVIFLDECFSGDTEILTENGFIRFDELKDQRVAQYRTPDGAITFVEPIRKIKKMPTSRMINFKSDKGGDFLITEKHNMLFKKNNKFLKATLADLDGNSQMISAGFGVGKDDTLTDIERLSIAYQTDGSDHYLNKEGVQTMSFTFSKERKVIEFKKLIERMGLDIHETPIRKSKGNVKERRRFLVKIKRKMNKSIVDLFDISTMSSRKAADIIEYMNIWDGHVATDNIYLYTSTSKKDADTYQSIACLAGFQTNMVEVEDKRKDSYLKVYRLFINKSKCGLKSKSFKKEYVEYNDYVYCVEVPDGNIVVRRGGNTLVTGNCHKDYSIVFEKYPNAIIIGMTGTPFTDMSMYECFVESITPQELRDRGYLVPDKIYCPHLMDTSTVKFTAGDFNRKELNNVVTKGTVVGNIVKDWIDLGENRPTVCFAVSVEHSKQLCHAFNEEGIKAVHCDAESSKEEREAARIGLENGTIKVVCNVDIFSTGWDCPIVSCIILARPSWSLCWYLQAVGRGVRSFDGKSHCIVLDNAGNVFRHGTHFKVRDISLEKPDKRKKSKQYENRAKTCEDCYYVFDPSVYQSCPDCGWTPPEGSRKVHTVDGKLIEYAEHELDRADRRKAMIIERYKKIERARRAKGFRPVWTFAELFKDFSREEMVHLNLVTQVPSQFLPLPKAPQQ